MALITSTQNGQWSAGATWVGGVMPGDGDSARIDVGDEVAFDVDHNIAGVTLVGLDIDGTLTTDNAADRYLKCNADIIGDGDWFADDGAGGDWPSDKQMTIDFAGGSNSIVGGSGLELHFRCAEPDNQYVRLSAPEAAGQTILSVDRDVTGIASLWRVGDTVWIANINNGLQVEEHVIDGIGTNTITIAAPGLTADKLEGSFIILQNRNIRAINSTDYAFKSVSDSIIGIEVSGVAHGYLSCFDNTIYGSVCGTSRGMTTSDGNTFSGGAGGVSNFWSSSDNCIMSGIVAGGSTLGDSSHGNLLSGIAAGNIFGVNRSYVMAVTGSIIGCGTGISQGSVRLFGATLDNNSDLGATKTVEAYNTLFRGGTEFANYTHRSRAPWLYSFSVDHDQVPGAFKAWTRGGIVTHDTGIKPPGETQSYKHACGSATEPVFKQDEVLIQPGDTRTYRVYVRRDAAMGWMPRAQLLLPEEDPLVDVGNTPLHEKIMTAGTGVWETMFLTYANTTDYPVKVLVRTLAMNGAGNAWFLVKGWGIGGMSRARLVNG